MSTYYNCHIHVFTGRAAPARFLPFYLTPIARNRVLGPVAGALFKALIPWSTSDRFERLAGFATIGRLPDSRAVFEEVRGYYSESFRFVVLSLDMDYMGAGRAPQPFLAQLEELAQLKATLEELAAVREDVPHGLVLAFISVDPRRSNVLDLVKRHIEERGFSGIKLYPPLGYWPADPRLAEVYRYAEANDVPVLSHCSRGGAFYKGEITAAMRTDPGTGRTVRGGRRDYTEALADPDNFRPVLQQFPRLRLCLAHYGGAEEWKRYLTNAMPVKDTDSWIRRVSKLLQEREWPNVYADISSTAADDDFLPMINVLANDPDVRDRILFGSDFYLIQRDTTERQFGIKLRSAVGPEAWLRMASTNPLRWLAAPDTTPSA